MPNQRELVPWTDDSSQPAPPMSLRDPYPEPPLSEPPAGAAVDDEDADEEALEELKFEEVLDDLNGRFILNLPEAERTYERLFWQAEEAHWFYEDYVRPLHPSLPALSQRNFTEYLLQHNDTYRDMFDYNEYWNKFLDYKKEVPCCGGILLNRTGDKALMVRGWKNNAWWGFPRGKININESPEACAIREVLEETGFDMSPIFDPNECIKTLINTQEVTMYLVLGVDENTAFKTKTMKEIGKIEWVPVVDLPTWASKRNSKAIGGGKPKRFFNVTPFVNGIKTFLKKKGVNLNQLRPNPPGRRGRGGGGRQRGGRDLQPFAFDAGPSTPGRKLQPFAFEDEPKPMPAATPTTAMDHLFATWIQNSNVQSDSAHAQDVAFSTPQAHVQAQTSEDQNDDDMLARLLGNVGTVSDAPPSRAGPVHALPGHAPPVHAPSGHAPSALLPLDTKQAKFLQVLQPRPPQAIVPTSPSRSEHQNHLLAVLSSPTKPAPAPMPAHTPQVPVLNEDEERAQRQRALLESTLLGYPSSPSSVPGQSRGASHGPSPHPFGLNSHGPSPMPQSWSPYPPPQSSPYPPSQPPLSAQPAQPPPIPQHTRPQQYDYAPQPQPQSPLRQPTNEHQRALLGTLTAGKSPQAQPHNASAANYGLPAHPPNLSNYGQPGPAGQAPAPTNYGQPIQPPSAIYGQQGQQPNANYGQPGQQPHPANYGQPSQLGQIPAPAGYGQPAHQPNANYIPAQRAQPPAGYYGHQRQLSGGLPGQPGQGRPIGAPVGLPGQPGQPLAAPGWNMQQFQFPNQGFPGQPGQPGQAPAPHHMAQGYQQHYSPQSHVPQYQSPQQQYQQPQQQQIQTHPQKQALQQQLQQQQQPNQPPARAAQTSPAMHQPVARPPLSGSLLGLAAGR